jgi:hypothetical protein
MFLNAENGKHAMGWMKDMNKEVKRAMGTDKTPGTQTPFKMEQK